MSKAVSRGKYGIVVMADLELPLMQSGEMEQYRSCIKEVLKKISSLLSIVLFVTNYQETL